MNPENHSQQSNLKQLLIKAQIALDENRFDEALKIISQIDLDEMKMLSLEELHVIGRLISHIKKLAEDKKANLITELNKIAAASKYLL